jgi:hypothetical protein
MKINPTLKRALCSWTIWLNVIGGGIETLQWGLNQHVIGAQWVFGVCAWGTILLRFFKTSAPIFVSFSPEIKKETQVSPVPGPLELNKKD